MQVSVITLFPEWVEQVTKFGMPRVAAEQGALALNLVNPRDFAENPWRRIDRRPYGGGPGMGMEAEPLARAIAAARSVSAGPVVALTPQGERFTQAWAERLVAGGGMTLLCGRYEGWDARLDAGLAPDAPIDVELSVGDVVLSGGELGAMMVIDACARLLPGVLGDENSSVEDSFSSGALDHPHYARPAEWRGQAVPEVLMSGDHAAIRRWRRQQALARTWERRPDLLDGLVLSPDEQEWLRAYIAQHAIDAKR